MNSISVNIITNEKDEHRATSNTDDDSSDEKCPSDALNIRELSLQRYTGRKSSIQFF